METRDVIRLVLGIIEICCFIIVFLDYAKTKKIIKDTEENNPDIYKNNVFKLTNKGMIFIVIGIICSIARVLIFNKAI